MEFDEKTILALMKTLAVVFICSVVSCIIGFSAAAVASYILHLEFMLCLAVMGGVGLLVFVILLFIAYYFTRKKKDDKSVDFGGGTEVRF